MFICLWLVVKEKLVGANIESKEGKNFLNAKQQIDAFEVEKNPSLKSLSNFH